MSNITEETHLQYYKYAPRKVNKAQYCCFTIMLKRTMSTYVVYYQKGIIIKREYPQVRKSLFVKFQPNWIIYPINNTARKKEYSKEAEPRVIAFCYVVNIAKITNKMTPVYNIPKNCKTCKPCVKVINSEILWNKLLLRYYYFSSLKFKVYTNVDIICYAYLANCIYAIVILHY